MSSDSEVVVGLAPNWRHVSAFLGLTFALTWLLDLAIALRGGLGTPGIVTVLQLQMLLPAFSAIVLGLLVFPESPIYRGRSAGAGRWFYYYFLLFTLIDAVDAMAVWFARVPTSLASLLAIVPVLLAVPGLVMLIALRVATGAEAMARVSLAWGSWRDWLLFGLAFVAFYILQAALNAAFGLGQGRLALPPVPRGLDPTTFVIVATVQSVLLAPILAIVIAFGEEYGWRGYLQSELFKLGRVRGVLLLGIIWGAWHWPLILMGYNYPGHPALGVVLMTLYTTGLAVVLGYVVLRSGSVLLAAYLHALNNQVASFIVAMGFRPFDPAFSFGVGIYGIATLAVVALVVLRDPIWRAKGSSIPAPGKLQ
jgi:membrane protease YdiL (CAAX protease family)